MTGARLDNEAATPPVSQAELRAFIVAFGRLETRISVIEERIRQAQVIALVGSNVTPLVFAAARLFDLPPERIVGKINGERLSQARRAIVWVARGVYGRSTPEIGRVLKRDHTTILDYDNEANSLRDTDAEFRDLTDRLEAFARNPDPIPLGEAVPPTLAAEVGQPRTGE